MEGFIYHTRRTAFAALSRRLHLRRTDPAKTVTKLPVNGGHASAQQLKSALADSERNNAQSLTCVDEVLAQRDVRQAFEKAPRAPAAGASTAALFNEKLRLDLLFSDGIIALHVMDVFPKYPRLTPVRSGNFQEVWVAFRRPWIGVFGPPYEHPDG